MIELKHEPSKELNLAFGQSKTSKKWKNETISWQAFVDRLSKPTVTQETEAEYKKMTKSERDSVKDVGGFVAGWLKGGRRKAGNVQSRSILALDADTPQDGFLDVMDMLADYAYVLHSTHSHTKDKPRYRILVPTNRLMTAEEYEPVIRYLAKHIGMENFDDTTYQAERLMFLPSCSRDAEYIFKVNDDNFLDVDEVLATYPDWRDASFWPESPTHEVRRKRDAKQQGDPLSKKGLIGAFCRTYDIHRAITELLEDVYVATDKPDRYTYAKGSTSGGLVIYDDKFAYSHHGTDPVGDQLVNAFDLVRIHKFGDLDESVKDTTPTNKRPSFKSMNEFVRDLPEIDSILRKEAIEDFGVEAEDDLSWIESDGVNVEINTFLLAQQILTEIPIFYDGFELLRYDASRGIWIGNAEEYLRSYISVKKLGKETKIRHLSETLTSIRTLSFSDTTFEEGDIAKIVLENGVYDFKKDEFVNAFDPDLKARSAHPIAYDAGADCPTFKGFLKEVIGEEAIDFLFEWYGYNFYREYAVQKMLFVHGKGGTGKSTIINLLREMVGAENYGAVTLQHLMQERFAKIGLYRKVANFDTDAKPQYLADGATLKMLTGEDAIYADRKNKEPITFYNYAKLTFAMNELPPMRDFSGGLKRRMLILRMDKVLTDEVKQLYPLEAIKREMPGIFNEAMRGLRRLLDKRQFSESKQMQQEVVSWEKGNDVVALFIEDECEVGEDLKTPVKEAYTDYRIYCQNSGYKPLSRNTFKDRMEELGYTNKAVKVGGKAVKCWVGIKTDSEI